MVDVSDSFVGKVVASRYAIIRKISEGGMGAVYLALQRPLDRPVALKVLLRRLLDDETAMRRFEKEARAVALLADPHIVTLYDFGHTENGAPFFAMEYLEGESLRQVLDREKFLPWQRALTSLRGVGAALAAAHAKDIIHRDLKPENVMWQSKGAGPALVKVLDFGLARLQLADGRNTVTEHNVIPGTPSYMAPERVSGINDDPRSDLYALGVMAFEMVTGRRPFDAESPLKTILSHVNDPVPSPAAHVPAGAAPIPDAAATWIVRLLQKDPNKRPASAVEAMAELETVLRAYDWRAVPPNGTPNDVEEISLKNALAKMDGLMGEAPPQPIPLTRRKTSPPMPAVSISVVPTPAAPDPFAREVTDVFAQLPHSGGDSTSDPGSGALPPPLLRTPLTPVAEWAERFDRCDTVNALAHAGLAGLAERFDRAFLAVQATPPLVVAHRVPEVDLDAAVGRSTWLRQHISQRDAYYGLVAGLRTDPFFVALGDVAPMCAFVGTIKRQGSLAVVFYGDHADGPLREGARDVVDIMRHFAARLTLVAQRAN